MKLLLLWCTCLIVFFLTAVGRNEQTWRREQSRPDACGVHGVCKCGENEEYYEVNCMNRTYKIVPQNILPNATKIDLSANALEYLPKGIFNNTPIVTLINLTGNSLTVVPEELFARTFHLEVLLISDNYLKELPSGLLANAPKLEHLFLGYNRITEIPDGFFNVTPGLQYLSIPLNDIRNLTKSSFAGLRNVNYMSFAWNHLTILPSDVFVGLHLNGTMDLSHNNIKEIPHGLFNSNKTHKLRMLFLQGNNITFLRSHSFKGLDSLKYIFLNNNNISSLEYDVFNGTNVAYIYLFGNNLRDISYNSFGDRNIKQIHLYENKIKSISQSALEGMNPKLKLFLNCNYLNHIPWSGNFVNMSCVNQNFVPFITFNRNDTTKLRRNFQREGFVCKNYSNRTTCKPCQPGTYGNGHGKCLSCQRGGFYQDQIGLKHCKTCVEGTFVNTSYASSPEQCKLCPEGTNQTRLAGYRACPCKNNYSRKNRFMGCTLCEEDGLNCTFDYKFLRPGYYWNWSFHLTNITLYADFVANLQTYNLTYDNSSIEYTGLMPFVHDCPNADSCLNNNSHTVAALHGTCAEGYRGWLCYQCENHYYRVLNSCKRCPGRWWIISETIVLVILVCFALYFLHSQSKDKGKDWQNGDRSLADKVSSRLKIVLGFYQVVGELFESLHAINWVGPLSSVGKVLSFRDINIIALFLRPRCLNQNFEIDSKLQFKIALSFPAFVLMTAVLVYIGGKLVLMRKLHRNNSEMKHRLGKLKSKIYYYILLVLFVTYTPTCVAIFSFYPGACNAFEIYQGRNDTIYLLRSDLDLKCDQNLANYHTAAYVATFFYILTFPCILLYLSRKYCRETDGGVDKFVEHEIGCHEGSRLLDNSDQNTIPFWMRFFCENYKARFWYWEVIELSRKVTQTAFVTLLGWEDSLTILSTIGLSVLFLTLHAKFSPMKSSFEQRLQMFSLTAIFINVLIVAVDIPHRYGALVSTLLILLNLIILVTITGEMALGILRFVRHKYFRH